MSVLARVDWLRIAAGICCLALLAVILLGGGRAFWYDEIFTLGAASQGPGIDWDALKADVHPPTYTLMVHVAGWFLGEASPWLRLVNLPAFLAGLWAVGILWRIAGAGRALVIACLTLCSLYALNLGLDLRSYAWLLGFGLLGHAALAEEVSTGCARTGTLILSAAVLTALHYFGAGIGLALLAVAALRYFRQGRLRNLVAAVIAIIVLGLGFLIWVLILSDTLNAADGSLWISHGIGPWLDFLAWQVPLAILALILLVYVRAKGEAMNAPQEALWLLFPSCLLVSAIIVASLFTPVASARNLIVLIPGLAIALALALPKGFLDALRRSPITAIVILLFCIRYGDTGTRPAQQIAWAITQATPAECTGATLYVEKPGIVERYAQALWAERRERPMVELTSFDGRPDLPAACDVIAAGWHKLGTRDEVAEFFAAMDLDVEVVPPPDSRLAASPNRTSGYVVRVR